MKRNDSEHKFSFLHFRATTVEQRAVRQLADQLRMSVSQLLRLLIMRGLEALLSESDES